MTIITFRPIQSRFSSEKFWRISVYGKHILSERNTVSPQTMIRRQKDNHIPCELTELTYDFKYSQLPSVDYWVEKGSVEQT